MPIWNSSVFDLVSCWFLHIIDQYPNTGQHDSRFVLLYTHIMKKSTV